MKYELAKQLFEAKFPKQTFRVTYPNIKYPNREGQSNAPTLSELIEVCMNNEDIYNFELICPDAWQAMVGLRSIDDYLKSDWYDTPEEAVANLWLKLEGK